MSDLPKTRKWNVRRKSAFMDQVQTDLDLADAMRDELLGRIAELEAELAEVKVGFEIDGEPTGVSILDALRNMTMNWQQAEAELTRLRAVNEALSGVIKQADEELAERDRMLHAVFTESMGLKPGALSEKGWLAYLRSRAEEGSKDE